MTTVAIEKSSQVVARRMEKSKVLLHDAVRVPHGGWEAFERPLMGSIVVRVHGIKAGD